MNNVKSASSTVSRTAAAPSVRRVAQHPPRAPSGRAGVRRDALASFAADIGQYSLLSAAEESELTRKVARLKELERVRMECDGDTKCASKKLKMNSSKQFEHALEQCIAARDALVAANLRLVVKIARASYRVWCAPKGPPRSQKDAVGLLDLVQEGALGLIRAAETFQPNLGFRFTTYAYKTVWSFCRRAATPSNVAVNIPERMRIAAVKVRRFRSAYSAKYGKLPSRKEEEQILPNVSRDLLRKTELHLLGAIDLDGPVRGTSAKKSASGDVNNTTVMELIPSKQESPEEIVDRHLIKASVREAVNKNLKKRDAQIVMEKFGLAESNMPPMTSKQIAKKHAISEARVHQIVAASLDKIRMNTPMLQTLLR